MTVLGERGTVATAVVVDLTTHRLGSYAVCAIRSVLGAVVAAGYLADYADREQLWGPAGVYGRAMALEDRTAGAGFNLFLVSDTTGYFEVVFHLGLIAALCVALGWGGRPVLVLCWALDWSLYRAHPWLLDGGGNLVHLVLPILVLTGCYRHLSLVRRRVRADRWVCVLLHNVGVLLIAVQVCLMYLVAGIYKMQGPEWVDGTALYYVLQVPEFYRPGPSDLLLASDLALALATFCATALQVFFPLLVLQRWSRPWVVLAMVVFHVSIALLMGLTTFALTMMACDLIFVERQVHSTARCIRSWLSQAGRGAAPAQPPGSNGSAEASGEGDRTGAKPRSATAGVQ